MCLWSGVGFFLLHQNPSFETVFYSFLHSRLNVPLSGVGFFLLYQNPSFESVCHHLNHSFYFTFYFRLQFSPWLRDLTKEGIEPNPGPLWGDFLDKLKLKLGNQFFSLYETSITKLGTALFDVYRDVPDTNKIKQYLGTRKDDLSKLGITTGLLDAINAALDGVFCLMNL